jgi:hypothetical protein
MCVCAEKMTDPATQVRRKARETPWLDFVRKLVMI